MKIAAFILAALGGVSGIVAALLWVKGSIFGFKEGGSDSLLATYLRERNIDPLLVGVVENMWKGSMSNIWAALWTAIAVLLNSTATFVDILSN